MKQSLKYLSYKTLLLIAYRISTNPILIEIKIAFSIGISSTYIWQGIYQCNVNQ